MLVIGGGIVGLSCAWSLLDHGIEVQVLDRRDAGAGASWGNAGYVAPALTTPLPHPSIVRYGLRGLVDPSSPVTAPLPADRRLLRFLMAMARHCTTDSWNRAMAVYRPLTDQVFSAFDEQQITGPGAAVTEADVLVGFRTAEEATHLLHELQGVATAGRRVDLELLPGAVAREREPHFTAQVTSVVRIGAQRYLSPARYVAALAGEVRRRGGEILADRDVIAVRREQDRIVVQCPAGDLEADAAILANGAWLTELARPHGVRLAVQAGRGYSFTVPSEHPLSAPVYLPAARVAVAPDAGRVRVTGMMEFTRPDAELDRRRISLIVRCAAPLLQGVDWEQRDHEWVGSRPLTADGLPLIGASRTPGVFVAGGHGMWGVTMGPLTGRLIAEQVATGVAPPEIRQLDPCR